MRNVNPWKISTLALVAALGLTIGTGFVSNASATPDDDEITNVDNSTLGDDPHVKKALFHLRDAKTELNLATTSSGNFKKTTKLKKAALKSLDASIKKIAALQTEMRKN